MSRFYEFFNHVTNILLRDRRGRDRMVVGFTTTYAISAYHQCGGIKPVHRIATLPLFIIGSQPSPFL
jgi:hypothetical protein